jgi:predicted helicase
LVTADIPDLHFVGDAQCFPLYWYEKLEDEQLFDTMGEKVVRDAWGNRYVRHDAITDRALAVFQAAYPHVYATRAKTKGGPGLNKEDIFYYVYGVLHSPVYRERYAANLAKELPRIPLTNYFEEFANAGRQLAHLHLHYEELDPWPTVSAGILPGTDPGRVQKIRWAKRKDPETGKRVNDYSKLVYNQNVTITGIPVEAQGYVVNGRSPLDWVIDRYQVKTDPKSGITNDPNEYSDDPCYIIDLIVRLVRVSMETQQIVAALPTNIDEIPHPDNWPAEWMV